MNADDLVEDIKTKMTDRKSRCYSEPSSRRAIRRPEEILRDVRGLKLRQRVSLVLGDEILREELEETIKNSTVNGVSRLDTIRTYQDFLLPGYQPSFMGTGGACATMPINDIKGQEKTDYSKSERQLRCKLAAVYRLVEMNGWSEVIFNHISVRVGDKDEFLLNPFGLLFSEVTSSSLLKCDVQGTVIDTGSTSLGLNKAGFVLHSCIHEARPDIHCIIHIHTPSVTAISSMKCGFLRVSQESLTVGNVSYHDYYGILVNEAEKESIKEDLGPENMVMILRNHGVVVCGKTIEEAYLLLGRFMEACEIQIKAMSAGLDNLNIISEEAYQQVQECLASVSSVTKNIDSKVTLAQYYFESQMRWLDSQGYRTGYVYHMPDVFISGNVKKHPESRIPPQVTSDRETPHQIYYDYQENSAVKRGQSMGRGNTHRNRFKWLNSPVQGTQYVKEERKPIEKEEPLSNGDSELNIMVNGHHTPDDEAPSSTVEESESKQTTNDGTTIITKTTTVVKTNIVTEEIEEPSNQVNGFETHVTNNTPELNGEHVENITTEHLLSPAKSADSLSRPSSEAGSLKSTERTKSPQKVKKQKSFKKALMKKLHKKEDKKEEKSK